MSSTAQPPRISIPPSSPTPTIQFTALHASMVARIQPDQIILDVDGVPNQDNWEPYTSVLGNSTFLVEANT